MSEEEQKNITFDTFDDSTKPKVITFHFMNGDVKRLDLNELDVEFKTESSALFTKPYEQTADDILKAIAKLSPNDSIYFRTIAKKGSDAYRNSKPEDRARVYLTQRSKIAYMRVSY